MINITSNEIANYLGEKFSNISNFKEMLASGENTLLLHKDDNLNVRLRWIGEKRQKSKNVIASLTINQDDILTNLANAVKLIKDERFIIEVYEKDENDSKKVYRFASEKQKPHALRIQLPKFDNSFTFLKNDEVQTIKAAVETAAKAVQSPEKAPNQIENDVLAMQSDNEELPTAQENEIETEESAM